MLQLSRFFENIHSYGWKMSLVLKRLKRIEAGWEGSHITVVLNIDVKQEKNDTGKTNKQQTTTSRQNINLPLEKKLLL